MAHFIYGVATNTGKDSLLLMTEEHSFLEVIPQTSGWLETTSMARCG